MKTTYKSKGLVYGKYWGGGEGAYEAEKYQATTKKKLEKMINDGILNNSIDSGMGYETVLGAMIEIETITTITIETITPKTKNDKDYNHSDYKIGYYGDLSEKQIDFLNSVFNYSI